jgi:TPR repeat protein
MYRQGRGFPRDDELAARFAARAGFLEIACGGQRWESCSLLGELLLEGRGAPRSVDRAVVCFTRACEGGHAAGCEAASDVFHEGAGLPRDPTRAAQLYQRGCDLDRESACAKRR